MDSDKLKTAILQHLLKHQGEWVHGKTLDALFSCTDRDRKRAIASLRFQFPIIAAENKQDGYKFSNDLTERRKYWDRVEKEIRNRMATVKIARAVSESGELFAQSFVIENQVNQELEI